MKLPNPTRAQSSGTLPVLVGIVPDRHFWKFNIFVILMKLITSNIDTIKALCNKYHVKTLFAFGSVTRDELKPDSDIDLLVDIDSNDPISYSDNYFDLKFQLEQLLKRHIDLLELRAIKNQYLKQNIENSKVLVYGKGN